MANAKNSGHTAKNRLSAEASPYLRQHENNPVDWHPWGEEAFLKAQKEQKPILLSVGYAACHWCHVMAHESFEDAATAELMNELFVNIKLDREERPDLDQIYQNALALMGQQGGWPLTMFLTPDGKPFWGGTYFPPATRFGRVAFPEVLKQISKIYAEQKDKIAQTVDALYEALQQNLTPQNGATDITLSMLDQIAARILQNMDAENGGFGDAPKFPQVNLLHLLWRAYKRTGNGAFKNAVTQALDHICQGGIYDHLGGGFARYTVDAAWLVPHFEKMLYDNAQLIEILTLVWQETKSPLYEARIRETVEWLLRDMRVDGAFASSYDADSEGVEGKFYVWTDAEIDAALGADSALFKQAYDVKEGGNWEGHTILNRLHSIGLLYPAEEKQLKSSCEKLFAIREKRVKPGFDNKVLADWNGLAIAALSFAGWAFGNEDWIKAAAEAQQFIVKNMSAPDGRVYHSYGKALGKGKAWHPATLDDYANMMRGSLMLYQATEKNSFAAQAEKWMDIVNRDYADTKGFFATARDTADVILRVKSAADTATPSGNATIVEVLTRLFYATGKDSYRDQAMKSVDAFSGEVARNFFPLASFLNAAEFLQGAQLAVLAYGQSAEEISSFLDALKEKSLPLLVAMPQKDGADLPAGHPAAGKKTIGGKAAAYLCEGTKCTAPYIDAASMIAEFEK